MRFSGTGSAIEQSLEECRLVQRKTTELYFQLASLRLYLAATLTGIKKAGFGELRSKVSEIKAIFEHQV